MSRHLETARPVPNRSPGRRRSRLAVAFIAAAVVLTASGGGALADTAPAKATSTQSLWGTATPRAATVDPDGDAVELGTAFTTSASGTVVGVKFWKTPENTGEHSGTLWSSDGAKLATATFTSETASGWQVVTFSTPVRVAAGERYVASYHAPNGRYSQTQDFTGADTSDVVSVASGKSGVYSYGETSSFPTKAWNASQYWVDVLFRPDTATTTPAPTATTTPTPKPTATTAPTAPAPAAGFPSASNTGVPAGVTLTPYTGPERITQPGTVIDSKLITTPLVIAAGANDVTIRNSLIRANGYWLVLNDEGATNLQITDTELDGAGNPNGDAAVGGRNYTLTRVNIHSTVDGLKLGDNVTVQDSYIHDLVMTDGSHNDGMQSLGSNNLKILHNTVIVADGSTSAIILSTGSADSMRNIRIENNLLGGGAYTVYGGYQAGTDDLSRVSDVVISNNRITTKVFPNGGAFGPFSSIDKPAVTTTGNVWHDGPNAGRSM